MNTNEKLQWCRDHWNYLKRVNRLEEAIQRILDKDEYLGNQLKYTVTDIIEMEESINDEYQGKFLR